MNRREFAGLVVSGAAAAAVAACMPPPMPAPRALRETWLNPVDKNFHWMPDLPRGLGLGINFNNVAWGDKPAMLEQALAIFEPTWWFHWWVYPISDDIGMVPMFWPDWVPGVAWWQQWATDMRRAGAAVPVAPPWLAANEPEIAHPDLSPLQVAERIQEQIGVLWQSGHRPNVMAPNTLISLRTGRAWLDEFAAAAYSIGLAYTPSVHIYVDNPVGLRQQWTWLRSHCARFGLREVVVTECGAGPDKTLDVWRAILPHFYALLDDPLCRALAPFGAYPADDAMGHWPGFSAFDGTINALGRQWIAERNRRA